MKPDNKFLSICIFLFFVLFCFNCSTSGSRSKSQIVDNSSQEPQTNKISFEAFQNAALSGDLPLVKVAFDQGIEPDSNNVEGQTALMLAAFNGQTEVIKFLVEEGAVVNATDLSGRTPLMYAATGPFVKTVKYLIKEKADINAADTDEQFTALMFAASEGQFEIVKVLLEAGADANLKDADNETAEIFAKRNQHYDIAAYIKQFVKK